MASEVSANHLEKLPLSTFLNNNDQSVDSYKHIQQKFHQRCSSLQQNFSGVFEYRKISGEYDEALRYLSKKSFFCNQYWKYSKPGKTRIIFLQTLFAFCTSYRSSNTRSLINNSLVAAKRYDRGTYRILRKYKRHSWNKLHRLMEKEELRNEIQTMIHSLQTCLMMMFDYIEYPYLDNKQSLNNLISKTLCRLKKYKHHIQLYRTTVNFLFWIKDQAYMPSEIRISFTSIS